MKLKNLAILSFAFASYAYASIPVEIQNTSQDETGFSLISAASDVLNNSAIITTNFNQNAPHLGVQFISTSQDSSTTTVYSMSFLWITPGRPAPYFLNSSVGYCSKFNLPSCANSVASEILKNANEHTR